MAVITNSRITGLLTKDFYNLRDEGARADGSTDDQPLIQEILNEAKTSGKGVFAPSGNYYLGDTIEIPREGVFIGESCHHTVFQSDINDYIIRNDTDDPGPQNPYMNRRAYYGHFTIQGTRTAGTSQHGLSLLRPANPSIFEQIEIKECGGNGLQIFEAVGGKFDSIVCIDNVGHGLLTGLGFASWTDATTTSLPVNAVTFLECKFQDNDGAGQHLENTIGCRFIGGYTQGNYKAFNDNTSELAGWNTYIGDGSRGNTFDHHWYEGQCKCFIYVFQSSTNDDWVNTFNNIYHSTSPGSAPVERLAIVDKGAIVINGHASNAGEYETTTRADGTAAPATHTTLIRVGEDNTTAWSGTTAYGVGDCVSNGGERYICTAAGTSAASGGPTGTVIDPDTRDITDGTVTWIWDGTEGSGRAGLIGVIHTSNATLGNYKQIENQVSGTVSTPLRASELLIFDSTIAST